MNTKRLNEISTAAEIVGDERLIAISDPSGVGQEVLVPLADLLALIRTPDNANFRFKDAGTLQLLNTTTGNYHSLWLETGSDGKPVLKWADNGDA